MAHEPLYYATYRGADVAHVGGRGYPGGQTVQIGKPDADAIEAQDDFEFDLEEVPAAIIGTAEEIQPASPHKARLLHQRLLKHSHDIDVEVGEA